MHTYLGKNDFKYKLKVILYSPFYFLSKKTWSEFKGALMKHEHQWDYDHPEYGKYGDRYYPCKHHGCNYCSIRNKDGSPIIQGIAIKRGDLP